MTVISPAVSMTTAKSWRNVSPCIVRPFWTVSSEEPTAGSTSNAWNDQWSRPGLQSERGRAWLGVGPNKESSSRLGGAIRPEPRDRFRQEYRKRVSWQVERIVRWGDRKREHLGK